MEIGKQDDVLKTLEDYEELRYNNKKEFDELNEYARSVNNGKITPFASFTHYKQVRRDVENQIFGETLADGSIAKNQTAHLTDRMIGMLEDINREGVSVEKLKDILTKGTVGKTTVRNGNASMEINYNEMKAAINPDTGTIIQVTKNKPKGK